MKLSRQELLDLRRSVSYLRYKVKAIRYQGPDPDLGPRLDCLAQRLKRKVEKGNDC